MANKITWANRLPRNLIRRLYESDARHIHDNELADEVGYGLYARAKNLIEINRTPFGKIRRQHPPLTSAFYQI